MDKADEDHKAFTKAYTHQNYTSQVLKTLGLCSGARNGVWCATAVYRGLLIQKPSSFMENITFAKIIGLSYM